MTSQEGGQAPPPRTSWLERQGYVAAGAFVGGAAVAAAALLLALVVFGGDDDEGEPQVVATATAPSTPSGEDTPAPDETPQASPSPSTPAGPTDADDALAEFVETDLEQTLIGDCSFPGDRPDGYCYRELYRDENLATFLVGPAFSEVAGEVVLMRRQDGSWQGEFIGAPSPDDEKLAIGQDAVVYGVGSCLNFRSQPSATAGVVTCQIDGTTASVVEGPTDADGVTWWRLEGLGWGSSEFLFFAGG